MTTTPAPAPPRHVPLPYASPRPRRWSWWKFARRAVQFGFVALFLWLLRGTEYPGQDDLKAPVNLFFRMDPLNALSAMTAGRAFLWTFWPAGVVLLLTALFGRVFCGWICPAGTLLDYVHRLLRPITRHSSAFFAPRIGAWRPLRYGILITTLIAGALGLPIVGYVDPFGLLFRGFTLVLDPAWSALINAGAAHVDTLPAPLHAAAAPLLAFLKNHAVAFNDVVYRMMGITAGVLAVIVLLELVARRFWCRYLCPLGALLGISGRWSMAKRLPWKECGKCKAASTCGPRCRMGAFNTDGQLVAESCTLCMDCVADCPTSVARFVIKKPAESKVDTGLTRRGFLTAAAVGVAAPVITRATGAATPSDPPAHLLRPPGVADRCSDSAFLDRCIRCGECLKVCPTNGLQPATLEAGLAGIYSPILIPRTGYCQEGCTLCSQVCPTHAIPPLPADQKATAIIGKAAFDRTRCLPWAKNEECLCCEEHCPLPDKAIKFNIVKVTVNGAEQELQRPYVVQERCIGCGICENKCPVEGPAAIHVYRKEKAPLEGPNVMH